MSGLSFVFLLHKPARGGVGVISLSNTRINRGKTSDCHSATRPSPSFCPSAYPDLSAPLFQSPCTPLSLSFSVPPALVPTHTPVTPHPMKGSNQGQADVIAHMTRCSIRPVTSVSRILCRSRLVPGRCVRDMRLIHKDLGCMSGAHGEIEWIGESAVLPQGG
jgi:hypothetical protein